MWNTAATNIRRVFGGKPGEKSESKWQDEPNGERVFSRPIGIKFKSDIGEFRKSKGKKGNKCRTKSVNIQIRVFYERYGGFVEAFYDRNNVNEK